MLFSRGVIASKICKIQINFLLRHYSFQIIKYCMKYGNNIMLLIKKFCFDPVTGPQTAVLAQRALIQQSEDLQLGQYEIS